jgi:hypothetical protein
VILKIDFKSGEQGVNYREFHVEAFHMEPTPDTIAPLLIHLSDMLTNLHPGDVLDIFANHLPELESK